MSLKKEKSRFSDATKFNDDIQEIDKIINTESENKPKKLKALTQEQKTKEDQTANILKNQTALAIDKKDVFRVIDRSKKGELKNKLTRLRSIHDIELVVVMHFDSNHEPNLLVGSILFGDRVIFYCNCKKYTRLLRKIKRIFYEDGFYETCYITDEYIPFTIDFPIRFTTKDRNDTLDEANCAVDILSTQYSSNIVMQFVKSNWKILVITGVLAGIMGCIFGVILGVIL